MVYYQVHVVLFVIRTSRPPSVVFPCAFTVFFISLFMQMYIIRGAKIFQRRNNMTCSQP